MTKLQKLSSLAASRRYAALTALCAILYLTNLGGYRLFDVDEPRYAQAAKQMVESGDWAVPYFNGEYRFEKPVLTYWLIGISYKLCGVNEFGARLPSALCAWGTVLLTCLLGTVLIAPAAGLVSGLVLALSIQFVGLGRMALTDMPLTFFFSLCLVLFFLADREERVLTARLLYLGSFIAGGLSVLAKGPVGVVLTGLIALLYLFLSGRLRAGLSRIPWIYGTLLLLAVILPWYILVNLRSDWLFFRVFIVQHNIQRFIGEVAPGGQHVEPFWHYLPLLLAGMYPWSFYTLQALWSPLRETLSRLLRGVREYRSMLFPLVWSLGVLIFFSSARAKLPTYITPALPPLAVLITAWWRAALAEDCRDGNRPALTVPAWVGALGGSGAAIFLLFWADWLAGFPVGPLPEIGAAAFAAGPLTGLVLLLRGRPRGALAAQVAGQTLLVLFISLGALPLVSEYRQEPQNVLLATAKEHLGEEGTLAAYRYRKTALVFYSGRVVKFVEAHQLAVFDSLAGPLAVITRERHHNVLRDSVPALELLGRSKDLILLGKK